MLPAAASFTQPDNHRPTHPRRETCRHTLRAQGANLPALSRALVACAWFGLQTHIGGASIEAMVQAVATGGAPLQPSQPLPLLGISAPQLGCFLVFWAAQVGVVVRGMHTIKTLELLAAPILIALSLALLAWAWTTAGGLGPMLAAPSQVGWAGGAAAVWGLLRLLLAVVFAACAACARRHQRWLLRCHAAPPRCRRSLGQACHRRDASGRWRCQP